MILPFTRSSSDSLSFSPFSNFCSHHFLLVYQLHQLHLQSPLSLSLEIDSAMDSGNSGSMQSSSSGDDQEFDSSSSFPHNFTSILAPQFLSHQTPNFFNSNLLQSLDHASDGDLIWSRGVRSDNQAFSSLGSSPPPNPTPATPQQQQRNPKKRPRASRRAPTTVLTTDRGLGQ